MIIFSPEDSSIRSSVCFMTVRVFKPRKSNLIRPNFSIWSMVNWVIISPLAPFTSGTYSIKGLSEMTTPEAWVDACRAIPSRDREIWSSFFSFSSPLSMRFNSGSSSMAFSSRTFGPSGTILAILSTSLYGIFSTRPTSRITALAFIVPKVMICPTLSRPYFSATYLITSSLPFIQKSISISGMLIR